MNKSLENLFGFDSQKHNVRTEIRAHSHWGIDLFP